jgi:hypothetical protein
LHEVSSDDWKWGFSWSGRSPQPLGIWENVSDRS